MKGCVLFVVLMLAGLSSMLPAWAFESPEWVVDPAAPGDHLPPVGVSLFDALFAGTRDGRVTHMLPFPFEKLLARVDAQLLGDPASLLPPAKRVLIPLGRSLQRTAAAPDYFRFPRVVVGVDSPPAPGALLLKDRLFVAYQEKSAVLEVISYNEAAGRFEFQLVKDYRAGGNPQVFYANRTICFACHQNGAPIFSRALWDETNANPLVAATLTQAGRSFYGIPVGRGVDVPYAIDNAVRRANRFALTQRLWREGCGGGEAGARCRGGLFEAALRLRLDDGRAPPPDAAFEAAVARPLRASAARLWPAGLAIGRPDLPNRNPLQGLVRWPDGPAEGVARSHVAARFDALLPRMPDTVWQGEAPDAVAEVVAGVAEFVADGDWPHLKAALARRPRGLARAMAVVVASPAGQSLLAGQPIPRAGLIAALFTALGEAPRKSSPTVLPPARLELPASPPNSTAGAPLPAALAGFHAWCAACHLSAEHFPPNFLYGPAAGLEARIRQCAPRIYVRLTMARRTPAGRDKTPMPPETMLPAFHTHAAAWAASPERAALEGAVAAMLKAESGREPDPDVLLAGGYEALRPCLAADR
jgi:mono/diheme cytochrome c family protein